MKVDDSKVTGPNAYVNVEVQNMVRGKLRGVAHVFARQVSLAGGHVWVEISFVAVALAKTIQSSGNLA